MAGPGSLVGEKYRLLREIGRGGMGSVWRAEHVEWGAPVAVKLMSPGMLHDADALARFEREARVAASLRSPHVVQVLDHGVDEALGCPFLVMELLEGESLATHIERHGRLSARETYQIMNQVGRALTRAHDAAIVHRDLKPDNIFLVQNEDELIAKVLDFGIAKGDSMTGASAGLTRPGSVMGTPYYMSPEQVRASASLDFRSDLWSAAVIACECLTGQRPFQAPDLVSLTIAICEGRGRRRPSELGPVPAGFDAWFERAAAIDRGLRFASARAQMRELQLVCEPSTASSAPVPEAIAEPGRLAASGRPAERSHTAERSRPAEPGHPAESGRISVSHPPAVPSARTRVEPGGAVRDALGTSSGPPSGLASHLGPWALVGALAAAVLLGGLLARSLRREPPPVPPLAAPLLLGGQPTLTAPALMPATPVPQTPDVPEASRPGSERLSSAPSSALPLDLGARNGQAARAGGGDLAPAEPPLRSPRVSVAEPAASMTTRVDRSSSASGSSPKPAARRAERAQPPPARSGEGSPTTPSIELQGRPIRTTL